ncbi:hypothetical protein K488DRAFT_68082 [Vararia minispora EC-137]|uniref:Uncharacterized protein n=1 Tax=Vararia minispora EC-137 TaxID=1314806 RepID=A0ACB8QWF9_9AGAM|nr:hypothetical protein K488DRAFT_68082 [Vararia minispora EC-137]
MTAATDARRLPPLSIPHAQERYQSAPYYDQYHADPTMGSPTSDVRSPVAAYPPGYVAHYQSMSSAMHAPTSAAGSSRSHQVYGAAAGTHYPTHTHHGTVGVERTVSSRHAAPMPYARTTSVSGSEYEPHAEPTIKKKRKRADARQLEVLNSVYARTAFPSTEERAQLGSQLGMSARSVQIW